MKMQKIVNKIFHTGLALSFLVALLPAKILMAVYTPSVIGMIWIFILVPITLITFIISSIYNIKNDEWVKVGKRTVLLLTAIVFVFVYLLFRAGHI